MRGRCEAAPQIAEARGKSCSQVAVAWCLAHGALPIPGVRSVAQARAAAPEATPRAQFPHAICVCSLSPSSTRMSWMASSALASIITTGDWAFSVVVAGAGRHRLPDVSLERRGSGSARCGVGQAPEHAPKRISDRLSARRSTAARARPAQTGRIAPGRAVRLIVSNTVFRNQTGVRWSSVAFSVVLRYVNVAAVVTVAVATAAQWHQQPVTAVGVGAAC